MNNSTKLLLVLFLSLLCFTSIFRALISNTQLSNSNLDLALPQVEEFDSSWQAEVKSLAFFDAGNELSKSIVNPNESEPNEIDTEKQVEIKSIEDVKLIGILLSQTNPEALILMPDQTDVQNIKLKDLIYDQWELTSIDATTITWKNISDDNVFLQHLFE